MSRASGDISERRPLNWSSVNPPAAWWSSSMREPTVRSGSSAARCNRSPLPRACSSRKGKRLLWGSSMRHLTSRPLSNTMASGCSDIPANPATSKLVVPMVTSAPGRQNKIAADDIGMQGPDEDADAPERQPARPGSRIDATPICADPDVVRAPSISQSLRLCSSECIHQEHICGASLREGQGRHPDSIYGFIVKQPRQFVTDCDGKIALGRLEGTPTFCGSDGIATQVGRD